MRHADGDVADVSPGVEPGAERVERAIVRVHRAPSEADRSTQKLATLVEHVGKLLGRQRYVNVSCSISYISSVAGLAS